MEKLLFFSAGNKEKEQRMAQLAAMLNLEFVCITPMQTGQQIGYLAGVEGFCAQKMSILEAAPPVSEEMLIFCGLAGNRLDLVLAMLRGSGLPVSLKAVMTAHNVGWTVAGLYRELTAERAQFQKKRPQNP